MRWKITYKILFVLAAFVAMPYPARAKTDKALVLSRQRAIDVETFYKIGDYDECSLIGDTIFDVENVYDAIALGYSALANHKLAFGISRKRSRTELVDRVYSSNYSRAANKAMDAYDYLSKHISDLQLPKKKDTSYFLDQLKAYSIAIACCRILHNQKQVIFLRQLSRYLSSLPQYHEVSDIALQAELWYFEILNELENRRFDIVIEELIPWFENLLKNNVNLSLVDKARIATVYGQMAEYVNYFAKEHGEEDSRLNILAVNLLIHSHDYSLFAKAMNKDFALHSWEDIRSALDEGSVACLFFVYSGISDSWSYIWCFDSESSQPELKYCGHSYWSEKQAMGGLDRYFAGRSRLYVVGTHDMMQTDFTCDSRVVRLHSLSEILKLRATKWDNSPVVAIGNINYSRHVSAQDTVTAKYKGHREGAKNFASAKREMDSMSSIFGGALTIYQGDDVSKKTMLTLNPDMSILHISTHGVFNKEMLRELNRCNPEDGITGDNILKSCMLKLSGYNEDEIMNTVSAYEVKNLRLDNADIVFISACESAAGQSLNFGDFSMAESFHIAGVKNIIAILDPIEEEIATRFAEYLYKDIASGKSYHDAFYAAKKIVCPYHRIILFE